MAEFLNSTQMTAALALKQDVVDAYGIIEGVTNGKTTEQLGCVAGNRWLGAQAKILEAIGEMEKAIVANETEHGK